MCGTAAFCTELDFADGALSRSELQVWLGASGWDPEEVDKLFAALDFNENEEVRLDVVLSDKSSRVLDLRKWTDFPGGASGRVGGWSASDGSSRKVTCTARVGAARGQCTPLEGPSNQYQPHGPDEILFSGNIPSSSHREWGQC